MCWQDCFSCHLVPNSVILRGLCLFFQVPKTPPHHSSMSRKCSICGQPGHYRNTCPNRNLESDSAHAENSIAPTQLPNTDTDLSGEEPPAQIPDEQPTPNPPPFTPTQQPNPNTPSPPKNPDLDDAVALTTELPCKAPWTSRRNSACMSLPD